MYKNYTAHAIKSLVNLIDNPAAPIHDRNNMSAIMHLLIKGEKFILPKGGRLLDDGLKGLRHEELHLPYQVICLEFDEDPNDPMVGEVAAPKRVALCVEGRGVDFFEMFGYPQKYPKASGDRCIYVQPINYLDEFKEWYPSMGGLLVPVDWDARHPEKALRYALAGAEHDTRTKAYPIAVLPTVFSKAVTDYGMTKAVQSVFEDSIGEVFALLEFLEALSCSNITTEKTTQLKASVNAKRTKKGKLPLYDYHCLTVTTGNLKGKSGSNGWVFEGGRSSPRQHLRRGHIRRLQPGKKVWVNSCVVGTHGKIDKDYRIT